MDADEFIDWRHLYGAALNQLKDASIELPAGDRREAIESKIKSAEDMLARADAKLAKELGIRLCDCTWPPQIFRWQQRSEAWVCPNPECGREIVRARPTRISTQSSWVRSRRGGSGTDWMGF